jgi:hypothetical protein
MMEDVEEDRYKSALDLADFPASFSVLLKNNVSCDLTEFEIFLIAFPVVGSCQAEHPRSPPAQTCRTGTACDGGH